MKELWRSLISLLILILILWAVFTFLIGVMRADSPDMEPRISPGDTVIFGKIYKSPEINDVIVFRKDGKRRLGRVIASAGDEVRIDTDNVLKVNDNMVVEHNIFYRTILYEGEDMTEYPLILDTDEYFVLSDMREGGEDSRCFGAVRKDEIEGCVIGIYRRYGI